MKVLILPDGLNWIVDRNCEALVSHLPDIEFTVKPYTKLTVEEFIREAEQVDLVHYFNWDIYRLREALPKIHKPLLISIRSHRFSRYVLQLIHRPNTFFHIINPDLLQHFKKAVYIPNGIFDQFQPDHEFTVGFVGFSDPRTHDYKGVNLIKQACEELGVRFHSAFGSLKPEQMPDYYRSLDLYVCASEAEGFSTAVMECMAMNVPVITVDTGVPRQFSIMKVERSVEGIKKGIEAFYTQAQVKEYRWEKVAPQYRELYEKILNQK